MYNNPFEKLRTRRFLKKLQTAPYDPSACNAGDPGSIPRLGRSPGEGNGNPLQYSRLENPMDRGATQAAPHGDARVGHNLATKPSPPLLGIYLWKTNTKLKKINVSQCLLQHPL